METYASFCAANSRTEIWRRTPDDFYSPNIHYTPSGEIGMNVGGHVIVMSIEEWHRAALVVAEISEADAAALDKISKLIAKD